MTIDHNLVNLATEHWSRGSWSWNTEFNQRYHAALSLVLLVLTPQSKYPSLGKLIVSQVKTSSTLTSMFSWVCQQLRSASKFCWLLNSHWQNDLPSICRRLWVINPLNDVTSQTSPQKQFTWWQPSLLSQVLPAETRLLSLILVLISRMSMCDESHSRNISSHIVPSPTAVDHYVRLILLIDPIIARRFILHQESAVVIKSF